MNSQESTSDLFVQFQGTPLTTEKYTAPIRGEQKTLSFAEVIDYCDTLYRHGAPLSEGQKQALGEILGLIRAALIKYRGQPGSKEKSALVAGASKINEILFVEKEETGTDTVRKYFTKVKRIPEAEYQEMIRTREGAKKMARILLQELMIQVDIIRDSNSIYVGADLVKWTIEIQAGDNTTLKSIGESMKTLGPDHDEIATAFLSDLFAINKVRNVTAGLEDKQKDWKGTLDYLDNQGLHPIDNHHRRLTKLGKEYVEDGRPYLAEYTLAAHQLYEALSAPQLMTVEDEDTGVIIHNYKVRSKHRPVPQSITENVRTRYAIQRALSACFDRSRNDEFAVGIRNALTTRDFAARKKIVEALISKDLGTYKESDPYYVPKTSDEIHNSCTWFSEWFDMNVLEGRLYTAEYDAGEIKKDERGQPRIGKSGYPLVDRYTGATATFKATVVLNASAGMMKYSVPGEAERGNPGPPVIRTALVSPLLPTDEYLYVSYLDKNNPQMGGTLREAMRYVTSAQELEDILFAPKTKLLMEQANEKVQGAVHEGKEFFQRYTEGLGIKLSHVVHEAPWSEGLVLEIDQQVEMKLQSVMSGIEYWLFRDNMGDEFSPAVFFMQNMDVFGDIKNWPAEYARYKRYIQAVRNRKGRSVADVSADFLRAERGVTNNHLALYQKLYKDKERVQSPEFSMKGEGWKNGQPTVDNYEYYKRASTRVFSRIFGIDLEQVHEKNHEGQYYHGEFLHVLFSGQNGAIDIYRTTKKMALGLLIIGQIQINKEAANISAQDLVALRGILNYDFWHADEQRLSLRIMRKMRGIKAENEFSGVGMFTQQEVEALFRDAGVPQGLFSQVEDAWKRIKQMDSGSKHSH